MQQWKDMGFRKFVINLRRVVSRDSERARDYDRRRGPSPGRSSRPIRDDRDRAYNNRDRGSDRDRDYDRERGHDRNRDRGYDRDRERGHERGPARDGRERSPVLKKARYGRSRSPGRPSLGADKNAKDRSAILLTPCLHPVWNLLLSSAAFSVSCDLNIYADLYRLHARWHLLVNTLYRDMCTSLYWVSLAGPAS